MLCLDSLPLREKNKTQLKDHKNSISQWAFEVDSAQSSWDPIDSRQRTRSNNDDFIGWT
jgi:hypothetical protein